MDKCNCNTKKILDTDVKAELERIIDDNAKLKDQLKEILDVIRRVGFGTDLNVHCCCKGSSSGGDIDDIAVIKEVKIEDGNLIFTFNTVDGEQTLVFDLLEVFNPSNYYTKIQTDNKLQQLKDEILNGLGDIDILPEVFNVAYITNDSETDPLPADAEEDTYGIADDYLYIKESNGWTILEEPNYFYFKYDGKLYTYRDGSISERIDLGGSIDKDTVVDDSTKDSTNVPTTKAVYDAIDSVQGDVNVNTQDIDNLRTDIEELDEAINGPKTSDTTDIFTINKTAVTASGFRFKDNPIVDAKIAQIEREHSNAITPISPTDAVYISEDTILTNNTFEANKEYIITSNIIVNSTPITIPACILDFERGNGGFVLSELDTAKITFNGTAIKARDDQQLFPRPVYSDSVLSEGIDITGSTPSIDYATPEWFGAIQLRSSYYARDLIRFDSSIHTNNNTNIIVKDEYIHANVAEPKAHLVHNLEFQEGDRPLLTALNHNRVYLYKPNGETDENDGFFVLDVQGNYYAVWTGSERWNTYQMGENNTYVGASAIERVVKAKRIDGLPKYYGGVIYSNIPIVYNWVASQNITFVQTVRINGQDVDHTINIVAGTTLVPRIQYFNLIQSTDGTYIGADGNEITKYKHTYSPKSNLVYYEFLLTTSVSTRPRYIASDDTLLDGVTFTKTNSFAIPHGIMGAGTTQYGYKIGVNLPRGLMSVVEVESKYQDKVNHESIYDLSFPYVSHDVFYDIDNNRFLLRDPFNEGPNGEAILYTSWINSSVWNDEDGNPREDVLYDTICQDSAEVQTLQQMYDRELYKAEKLPCVVYIKDVSRSNSTYGKLIRLVDKLIEERGVRDDRTCFRSAAEFGKGNVKLIKNGKYWVGNVIYGVSENFNTFVYDGQNSTIFAWSNSSIPKISYIVDSKTMYVDREGVSYPTDLVSPLFTSQTSGVYSSLKNSSEITTISIKNWSNGVIKNLRFVTIKDKSLNGSDAGNVTLGSLISSGEWRENAASSARNIFDIASCSDIIIQNIRSANFRKLYSTKAYTNSLETCSNNIYFDKIIHDRAEMGTVPRNVTNLYHSNMQLGMDSRNGPSGDHLIYGQTLYKHMYYDNCHFYTVDGHTPVQITFHGASIGNHPAHQDDAFVRFKDCIFEGSHVFSGGNLKDYEFIGCKLYVTHDTEAVSTNSDGAYHLSTIDGVFNRANIARVVLKNCDMHLNKTRLFNSTHSGDRTMTVIDGCTIKSDIDGQIALGEVSGEVKLINSIVDAADSGILVANNNAVTPVTPSRANILVSNCKIRCRHNVIQDEEGASVRYSNIKVENTFITFTQQVGDTSDKYTAGGGNWWNRNINSVVFFRGNHKAAKVIFKNVIIKNFESAEATYRKKTTDDAPFTWLAVGPYSVTKDNVPVYKGCNMDANDTIMLETEALGEIVFATQINKIVAVTAIDESTGVRTFVDTDGNTYTAQNAASITA